MSDFRLQFFCHAPDVRQEFKVLLAQSIFDGALAH
jgi:hypothetical protein